MRKYKVIFPDVFTLFNLFCGFWAITSLIDGQPYRAAWLIVFASVADALDGRIARATKLATRFGLELDSLVDVVSFGVVPAVLVYSQCLTSYGIWGVIIGFLPLSAAAIRLARFNIAAVHGHTKRYIGLPSPIAAITLGSFYLFSMKTAISFPYTVWLTLILLVSILMVSTISYDPLPNISFKEGKSNTIRLVLLFFMLILLMLFREITIFPCVIIYILFGVLRSAVNMIISFKSAMMIRNYQNLNT